MMIIHSLYILYLVPAILLSPNHYPIFLCYTLYNPLYNLSHYLSSLTTACYHYRYNNILNSSLHSIIAYHSISDLSNLHRIADRQELN